VKVTNSKEFHLIHKCRSKLICQPFPVVILVHVKYYQLVSCC